MATVALRRRGVFVRVEDLWVRLHRVRRLVFDKTGTLTLETPVLQNPETLRALSPDALAALHRLVRDNPHPVCQALLQQLLAFATPAPAIGEAHETIGCGVELGGWSLGRPGWRSPAETPLIPAGISESIFAHDGRVVARFRFADTVRPDARREVATLTQRGFGVHILSGDRHEKVAALAADLGLPAHSASGELSPQQKAAWFEQHDRRDTLMLGDGANDSLAFDRALCRGTPVIHRGLLEQKADFYYLGHGISGVRALFEVNAIRRRTQFAILIFSVVYNALAVGLAVAGHMNPLVAAVLMPVNSLLTLIIVMSSMRRAFRPA
jgi:Cu2+-exporting ATPase